MSQVSAGTPSNCPAATMRADGEPGGGGGLCSSGLCDLGRPCTLSGPKSGRTGRAGGGHSESRPHSPAWALGRLLGGGAWPGPAGCLIRLGMVNAVAPPSKGLCLCDLDGVCTLSAPQFPYL